ncbi:MAG: serine hydrolase domain-containing protein [Acidimicrobiales bacterium]
MTARRTTTLEQTLSDLQSRGIASGDVRGVAASVGDRSGILFEGAFGTRDGEAPMTTDTIGWLASMTKPVTGAVAMQLVEAGDLDLDAPVAPVLPQLAEVQVLDGFDAEGRPVLRPPTRPVTLRHLLTHTSGFCYEMWNADLARYQEVARTPSISTRRLAALDVPLMFDPGDRWEYGISIDLVGRVIEAITGETLGERMRSRILEPLAMSSTTFGPDATTLERLAGMHARAPDGSLVPIEVMVHAAAEFDMGGGGLYGTVGDYLRFLRMILGDGSLDGARILEPETVALMASNNIGDRRVTRLVSIAPDRSNDAELLAGVPKSWGLTFQINDEPAPTGRPAGGLMWAGLANCYFWIDRTNGVGGVYMTQILPFADERALGLYYAFETACYREIT